MKTLIIAALIIAGMLTAKGFAETTGAALTAKHNAAYAAYTK